MVAGAYILARKISYSWVAANKMVILQPPLTCHAHAIKNKKIMHGRRLAPETKINNAGANPQRKNR